MRAAINKVFNRGLEMTSHKCKIVQENTIIAFNWNFCLVFLTKFNLLCLNNKDLKFWIFLKTLSDFVLYYFFCFILLSLCVISLCVLFFCWVDFLHLKLAVWLLLSFRCFILNVFNSQNLILYRTSYPSARRSKSWSTIGRFATTKLESLEENSFR